MGIPMDFKTAIEIAYALPPCLKAGASRREVFGEWEVVNSNSVNPPTQQIT
ncbi:hypothetical protein [Nostoc sp.]